MNLKKLLEQRAALLTKIADAKTSEELDNIEIELRKLDMQITEAEKDTEEPKDEEPAARSDNGIPEQRNFNPLGTFRNNSEPNNNDESEDIYNTLEYRKAFKSYVVSGTPIPAKFNRETEQRADMLTTVGEIGAVIPTTIMNKVIEDLTVEGKIISRITQTSVQGGIAIPISEVLPEAKWLESEEQTSDEQKSKMEAKLTFGYHVLEAKIGISLLSATVALPIFESTVVKQLKKAMIKAIEIAIVEGSGSGRPLGFTKYSLAEKQNIYFDDVAIRTVNGWALPEAALPEAYEDGAIYVMNKATWEKYLNSMTSSTGQKIGLGKINEKGQKILNGREVLTIDTIPSYDVVKEGEIFGALINLEDYLLNSNLSMYYKKYFNEDKNKWIHKALMIADGKMAIGKILKDGEEKLVGAGGLIYLRKFKKD